MDPSLRNWGLVRARYDVYTGALVVDEPIVVSPQPIKSKQVRQNSKDIDSATSLVEVVATEVQRAHLVAVEVPVGSKSARAMASYGICIGILGALKAFRVPLLEVTPTQVKLAAVGHKTASKEDMMDWARAAHPEATWPTAKATLEHAADALGAIYASMQTNEFNTAIQAFKAANEGVIAS